MSMTRKREIKALLRQIAVRKKEVFRETLSAAGANLNNLEELEKIVDRGMRNEHALTQIRAVADQTLKEYHNVDYKGGFRAPGRLTAQDLMKGED